MIKDKTVTVRLDRVDEMVLENLTKELKVSPGEILRRALRKFSETSGFPYPTKLKRELEIKYVENQIDNEIFAYSGGKYREGIPINTDK